jgi:hypothetical protein
MTDRYERLVVHISGNRLHGTFSQIILTRVCLRRAFQRRCAKDVFRMYSRCFPFDCEDRPHER